MGTGSTSFPVANFNASTTFTNPSATPPGNYFFIRDPADTTNEIVLVYSGGSSSTTWYVQRGMNGATVAHSALATWVQVIAPYTFQNFKQSPGAAVSPVTVGNTATETIVAAYYPTADQLAGGTAFDIYAFGHFTHITAATTLGLTWRLCWGNTLALGGTQLSGLSTITTGPAPTITQNSPSWTATTMTAAGLSFDINGQVILLSPTSATSNINWWYSNANNTTTTAANALTSPAAAVTISGSGPLLLTAQWSTANASNTLTATAPLICRVG